MSTKDIDHTGNNDIIKAYKKKIEDLHNLASHCNLEEIPNINQAIRQYGNMLMEMENADTKKTDNNDVNNNGQPNNKFYINEKDFPVFQLIEEPPTTKNNTKASYKTAESFANAFEEAISMNDLDIKNCWRNYLPKAFINSKNNIYVRWY